MRGPWAFSDDDQLVEGEQGAAFVNEGQPCGNRIPTLAGGKKIMRDQWIAIAALWLAMPAHAAEMSGADIMTKSRLSYASLQSYRGTTSVKTTESKGGPAALRGTAKIDFSRPDQIKIEGEDAQGHFYQIVSDGKSTTLAASITGNMPRPQESVQLAIVRMTGIANKAPTHIPALLMDLTWGHPYARLGRCRLEGREMLGGKETYRVVDTTAEYTRTYWVDTKSFLLRQLKEEQTAQQSTKRDAPAQRRETVYSFSIEMAVSTPKSSGSPTDLLRSSARDGKGGAMQGRRRD
jgi:hypothetical protein